MFVKNVCKRRIMLKLINFQTMLIFLVYPVAGLNNAKLFRKIIKSLKLDKNSFVIEVASNDGYLLKNFIEAGINCLGIEPTKSTADVAENLVEKVLREFLERR